MATTSLLRLPAVLARTGYKKTSLYGLIKAGKFPAPIPLTPNTRVWIESEIDSWIENHIAAIRGGGAR
jgi:prophage regulatory protein